MKDNSLPALISLTTSRSRLEHVIVFDETANSGSRVAVMLVFRLSIHQEYSANSRCWTRCLICQKKTENKTTCGDEKKVNYRVQFQRAITLNLLRSPKDHLEGPFSRKEMCYWSDKRVVGPASLLRVVVTNPQNLVLYEDLGPGLFKDMEGNKTSDCPFSDDVNNAPTFQARSLFPEWFRAFRMVPKVPRYGHCLSWCYCSSTSTTKSLISQVKLVLL